VQDRSVRVLVSGVAILTGLVAISVLGGWLTTTEVLIRVVPGGARMVPATALGFLLCAAALGSVALERPHLKVAQGCAVAVLALGTERLLAYGLGTGGLEFLGLTSGIDSFGASLGHMSPATALDFVLLGAALLMSRPETSARAFQAVTLLALLVGWLGLTRYLYGGQPLVPLAAMAFHTATLFILLSVTTLTLRRDAGLVALISSVGAGGPITRRLLPTAVLLPVLLAWIAAYALHVGWMGPETGLSVLAGTGVIVFGALVWSNATLLERTDHKRHQEQEAREEVERRTELIIENALDAVVSIDAQGVITGWNSQAARIFGWTKDEALGQALEQTIIPAKYGASHLAGLRRYTQTGQAKVLNQRLELTGRSRDGREFPVELSIVPIGVPSGSQFSAFIRDISERKRTEGFLRENQAYLQILTETVPNLVWTCKADGSCDFMSLQWAQYTGKPAAQQLGWAWLDQLHPDDRARISQDWIRAVVGKRAYETEFRIRRADGAYRWFQTRAQAVRDEAGEITHWIGSSTDIDDLKRAEQKLRTQLERLRLLDRSTRAIGSRQDPASVLAIVMATLEQEFAIDLTCACLYDAVAKVFLIESVGTRGAAAVEPPGIRKGVPLVVEARGLALCMQGQLVYEPHLQTESYTFPALAAAGFGSFVLAPLGAEGTVLGVLVAARKDSDGFSSDDCEFLRQLSHHLALALNQAELYSALQRAYEDLRQTQQRAIQEERLRALGQMASGIAHDINNALAPATLYLDILREHDKQLSEVSKERLGLVQRAVESVANTVGRMREFYRSGGTDPDRAPLAVNQVIEHAIALTRARWDDMPKEQGLVIQVQTQLGVDLPDIMGVQSELRDAVTNLVLNAVDAMPGGGTLTLRSRSNESGRVCIDVSDTGVGMDTQTRLRCLEPFFTTKGERGTGLGLATVYGMLNRYSGEIEIDSTPGVGTRITLSFPPVPRDSQASSGPPTPLVPQRSMRILIIDDDPVVLRTMQSTLETDGHRVSAFDGGAKGVEEFLAQIKTQPYDVVITDLGMPYMDGRKVAAAVKGARPQTPVLLLTGWGQRMRAQDEHPEHVDRVLAKPPRLSDLRQALAELDPG
jgi:PAS domain S-box-containing protein